MPSSFLLREWQTSSETPEAALEVKRAKAFAADRSADSGGLFFLHKNIQDEALGRQRSNRGKRGDIQVAPGKLVASSASPVEREKENR